MSTRYGIGNLYNESWLDSYKNELSLKRYDTTLNSSIFDKNDVYLSSDLINMMSTSIKMTSIYHLIPYK